jgi:hypothetical protein
MPVANCDDGVFSGNTILNDLKGWLCVENGGRETLTNRFPEFQ